MSPIFSFLRRGRISQIKPQDYRKPRENTSSFHCCFLKCLLDVACQPISDGNPIYMYLNFLKRWARQGREYTGKVVRLRCAKNARGKNNCHPYIRDAFLYTEEQTECVDDCRSSTRRIAAHVNAVREVIHVDQLPSIIHTVRTHQNFLAPQVLSNLATGTCTPPQAKPSRRDFGA